MNKTELIGAVAQKAELSKADAKKAVDAVITSVVEALETGDRVAVLGFGSFVVADKAERNGVNPKTKEKIIIPARKVIKFKPGSSLAKITKE